jgi:hypothetical protein
MDFTVSNQITYNKTSKSYTDLPLTYVHVSWKICNAADT